jgi:hypothetical protein
MEVYDPPTLLAAMPPTRVALSFMAPGLFSSDSTYTGVLGAAMGALPLDSLVTLTVQVEDPTESLNKEFWLRHSQMWPLLRRVLLASADGERGHGEMLLEDRGNARVRCSLR